MNFIIFGLGAIGSNLLLRLAQQYSDAKFEGVDFDKVEDRNIKTQAYFQQHIGIPKVNAMQSVLGTKLRKIHYVPWNYKLIKGDSDKVKDFIKDDLLNIDCFDNTESRQILHELPIKDKILHIGFSPEFVAEITWGKDYKVPGDLSPDSIDICTLYKAGAFINLVVNASAMVIDEYVEKGTQQNLIINNYNIIKT